MNLPDLSSQIRTQGFYPIRVESLPDSSYDNLSFVGTLAEYLEVAKVLGVKAIFVSTISVAEEHFFYQDPDENDEPIDLCSLVPSLRQFKAKVGEDGNLDLSIPITSGNLTFSILNEWMQTLAELLAEAREQVEEHRFNEQATKQAQISAQSQSILKKLRALITDENFTRLPTQLAMRAFAIDKYPEVETLDESTLKREIQELRAKIQAKNPRRK
jgi:hypothetical protein